MGRLFKIIFGVLPFLVLTGCFERINKTEKKDQGREIARVGNVILYEKSIKDIYSPGISEADSVKLLEAYAESWVRRQIKLQEAERILSNEGVDIESKVNDYRTSLLNRSLDQYYVDKSLDTLILPSEIDDYYKQHRSEFVLDRDIIKGRIVRVPNTFRQQAQLKTLMGSPGDDKQQDFLDMCTKNNFELTVFEQWTDFRVLLSKAPTMSGRNYDDMLQVRKVQELSDTENKYFIQITESLKKGENAPQEWVEEIVRRIILTQRRNEIIRSMEDSLYNSAATQNKIKINIVN